MKRRVLVTVMGVVLCVALGAVACFYLYRTVTTQAEQAVSVMSADERAAFAQLSSITRDMDADQVYQVLGPPSEDLYLLAKWNGFGGSIFSQARIYFVAGHPAKIRWLKLGFFTYERTP